MGKGLSIKYSFCLWMTIIIDTSAFLEYLVQAKSCSKSSWNEQGGEGGDRATKAHVNAKLQDSVLGSANKQQGSQDLGRARRKPAEASLSLPQLCFYCCGLASKIQTLNLRSPKLVYCCCGKAALGGNCPHWRETAHLPGIAAGRTPLVSDAITIITLNWIFFFFYSLFRSGLMKERQQIPSSSFVNNIQRNPRRIRRWTSTRGN